MRLELLFLRIFCFQHKYFNSIKVRLEHLNYAQAKNAYANFNSIKVRLERNLPCGCVDLVCYFNSIKVRLELGETFNQVSPFKLFQFHKGAIRTKRFWLVIITCSYFNSIKVRLELINSLMLQLFPKFQFHKGAIRTLRLRCCGQSRTPFQFHKGAIRTSILILWWMVVVHFNSIKVRLELSAAASL